MKKIIRAVLKVILVLFILVNIITAFHAYKFTHFYDNGTITIKKNTDKTGWDKTKEICFGINAVKKLNNVADSGTQTIYLITKDSLKLEGWYVPVNNAVGTVALFHGHGGTKSDVQLEAEEFRKLGYNTFSIDFRAHGNSGGNTTTIGYNEAEDVKLAYDYVQAKGEKNIVLWGISMGASTILKAVNDYEIKPNKLIIEMPFGSILKAAEGRIKMMHIPAEPLATLITFWGSVEHGFWAFKMKPDEFAKKVNCPVLEQWGRNDPRVSQQETNDIYNNITTQKKLVIYENSGHESLCKSEHEKWVTEITSFLK